VKIDIAVSVSIVTVLGSLLVWLSIIVIDIEQWSAVDLGVVTSNQQVNGSVHNAITTTGGAI
jgi:hypothetical protein